MLARSVPRVARLAAVLAVVVGTLAAASPALAQDSLVPQVEPPPSLTKVPPGWHLSGKDAISIANRTTAVRRARAAHPGLRASVGKPSYKDGRIWDVLYVERETGVVDVLVDDASGKVAEVWTGPQVDTLLARGYEPSLAR